MSISPRPNRTSSTHHHHHNTHLQQSLPPNHSQRPTQSPPSQPHMSVPHFTATTAKNSKCFTSMYYRNHHRPYRPFPFLFHQQKNSVSHYHNPFQITSISFLLCFLLVSISLFPSCAHAHSFLTYPEPYTRCDNRGRHICPPPAKDQWNRNCVKKRTSAKHPAAKWHRGQRVTIKWARNNHNGGFIRMAFVPVMKMFDANALRRLSFYYGCWEQGKHRCKGPQCGSDLSGWGFRRRITVPSILPDGDYVLAWIWFGGTDQPRTSSQFGDYSSCAFIRIQGGRRLRRRPMYPFFRASTKRQKRRKTCLSYTSRPGACRHGCRHLVASQRKPYPFNQGYRPKPLWPKLFKNRDMRKAICNGSVCCPIKCRVCEGFACGTRRGGARNCCPNRIRRYQPKCKVTKGRPPCVM